MSAGERIPTVRTLGPCSIAAGPTSKALKDERPYRPRLKAAKDVHIPDTWAMKVATSSAFSAVTAEIRTFSVNGSRRSRQRASVPEAKLLPRP